MSNTEKTIHLVIDECAELFGGDRPASDAFDRAVADALALLDHNSKQPNDKER